jgi:hypothetical protein
MKLSLNQLPSAGAAAVSLVSLAAALLVCFCSFFAAFFKSFLLGFFSSPFASVAGCYPFLFLTSPVDFAILVGSILA